MIFIFISFFGKNIYYKYNNDNVISYKEDE